MRESGRERVWRENPNGWETRPFPVRDGGRSELTSFFFSNFPDDLGQVELWRIFQRWGSVREVVVAGKKTREGRRFGFVRFAGVRNIKQLEYQLDKILIGNMKMFVNLPRFGKRMELKGSKKG